MNGRLYHEESHSTWKCDYHIVWCPKYRGEVLKDRYIKLELKRILKAIAKWKGFYILAWHIGDEHIHLYISVPPKHSVAYVMAVMKGKSSTWIKKKTKKFPQGTLWQRGYFVSTTGANEHTIRNYVNNQSHHQVELEQKRFSIFH